MKNDRQDANKAPRDQEVVILNEEESINFAKAVLNPPKPNDFVRSEVRRYRKLIRPA